MPSSDASSGEVILGRAPREALAAGSAERAEHAERRRRPGTAACAKIASASYDERCRRTASRPARSANDQAEQARAGRASATQPTARRSGAAGRNRPEEQHEDDQAAERRARAPSGPVRLHEHAAHRRSRPFGSCSSGTVAVSIGPTASHGTTPKSTSMATRMHERGPLRSPARRAGAAKCGSGLFGPQKICLRRRAARRSTVRNAPITPGTATTDAPSAQAPRNVRNSATKPAVAGRPERREAADGERRRDARHHRGRSRPS